jgi:hypothetical protein
MNNSDEFKKDLLKEYISPGTIEKAPTGFTSKVMMQIQTETSGSRVPVRSRKINTVPVVSVIIIVSLLVAAFLMPGSKSDTLTPLLLDIVKNISSSLPVLKVSSFFSLTVPSVLIYVFIGIFILSLFDRALYGLFHRERRG